MVMKKYEGSLSDRFNAQLNPSHPDSHVPLSLPDALVLGLHVARALEGLHAADIRMQDLKPGNILFDKEGVPVLTDFGVAAIEGATQATSVGGTGNYMCAEMFEEQPLTTKVDIWAFGVVLVEALSGQVPWFGLRHHQIMTAVLVKKQIPTVPADLPAELQSLLARCFEHDPTKRPSATELVQTLEPMVAGLGGLPLLAMHANALLQGSWAKRDAYAFIKLTEVVDITDPAQQKRYDAFTAQLEAQLGDANEHLLFHGCSPSAQISIAKEGFSKAYWTTAAGAWQRYGPGFYFALQASKSHEYPMAEMKALPLGPNSRSMLLCKVAKGKVHLTGTNMPDLGGVAPAGCHSVLGVASHTGPLNYDELVVYDEAAILPYAKVTYEFVKLAEVAEEEDEPEPEPDPHAERFVIKATEEVLTIFQLFDREIPKSQCWTLTEASGLARADITGTLDSARAQETVYSTGLTAIEAKLAELEHSRGRAETAIDEHLDRSGGEAVAQINDILQRRKAELQADLAHQYGAQKAALEAQHAEVAQKQAGQQRICHEGASVLGKSDLEVMQLKEAIQQDMAASALTVPPIEPMRTAELPCVFGDLSEVRTAYMGQLGSLGRVGCDAPVLTSYGEPTPTYKQGVAIAPNAPVGHFILGQAGMFFDAEGLPPGLALDRATGVITGTLAAEELSPVVVSVVATNDAGSSETLQLPIRVEPKTETATALAR
jgi:hypothetical protein